MRYSTRFGQRDESVDVETRIEWVVGRRLLPVAKGICITRVRSRKLWSAILVLWMSQVKFSELRTHQLLQEKGTQ